MEKSLLDKAKNSNAWPFQEALRIDAIDGENQKLEKSAC